MRLSAALSVLTMVLFFCGCGQKHIATPEEQIQQYGYFLQHNPRWIKVDLQEHPEFVEISAGQNEPLDQLFAILKNNSFFIIFANKEGKLPALALGEKHALRVIWTEQVKKGERIALGFDEDNNRFLYEYATGSDHLFRGFILTENGYLSILGSCPLDDRQSIDDIRDYYSSITLSPSLQYRTLKKSKQKEQ